MAKAKKSQAATWAVTVRLADGSTRFYAAQSGRQGQQEWTPRERQAFAFDTEAEAASFAARCVVQGEARAYAVVARRI